jgi:tetratricopeptide (TPR) repeat protein/transcriptional regulator with XRE-family HTH domain
MTTHHNTGASPGGAASLAAWLRAQRERAALTQEELAERSGVSVGTISGIETGHIRRPRIASLRRLADALGLAGPERQALLDGTGGQPGRTMVVPRQLPADVVTFTGRQAEMDQLERVLAAVEGTGPVVISAIQGAGGIGKSALAVHAAHRLAACYPDGQLYVNLHGATAGLEPLEPLEVLGRFLRALGVDPAAIPADVDEAAARFRSELAGRCLLVVLDNARDAGQVRPLVPGTPGCGVLVTSRRTLADLDGAHHLRLDVLPTHEAVALLGRLAGVERVAAEPDTAREIARLCGHLPLALRIAGARLAARPAWSLGLLAGRLADAQRRLDELELADTSVRASLAVSHQELAQSPDPADQAAARAFGLLGLPDGPDLSVPVAARLLDTTEEQAEGLLERLVDAQLLESPVPGRYRLHDLLRAYARERAAEQHQEVERAAALTRALGFYTATARHTLGLLRPGDQRQARADDRWCEGGLEFADDTTALAWLEAERANLLAAIQQAAESPGIPGELAIQLARALVGFFVVRSCWQDWVEVNQAVLRVARQEHDQAAQAQAHNDLGHAHLRQGRYDLALACLEESLAIRRELGDRYGQGSSLNNLGNVHQRQGRYAEALACYQESLILFRELGHRGTQAVSLGNLGNVYQRQGRYAEALACYQESLAIRRELGDRHGEAVSLGNLGEVHQRQGRFDLALACQQKSLAIRRELGDREGVAYSLNDLGIVHQRQGRYDLALACQQESLALRRELGDRYDQAESLRELGVTLRALGRHQEAHATWREALAIFEQLQAPEVDQVRAQLAE